MKAVWMRLRAVCTNSQARWDGGQRFQRGVGDLRGGAVIEWGSNGTGAMTVVGLTMVTTFMRSRIMLS